MSQPDQEPPKSKKAQYLEHHAQINREAFEARMRENEIRKEHYSPTGDPPPLDTMSYASFTESVLPPVVGGTAGGILSYIFQEPIRHKLEDFLEAASNFPLYEYQAPPFPTEISPETFPRFAVAGGITVGIAVTAGAQWLINKYVNYTN